MARKNLLTGANNFAFKPDGLAEQDLTDSNSGWTESVPIRHAAHEYLKRDGGEIEPLGAGIRPFSFRIFFTGPNWKTRYLNLVSAILQSPFGLLTHPLYGGLRVFCTGIDQATVEIGQALDTITFSLGFKEDAVDTGQPAPVVSVSFQSQQVQAAGQALTTAGTAPRYTAFPGVPAAILTAVTAANTYATAAALAVAQAAPDFTLSIQLSAVQVACVATIAAMQATGIPDPLLYGDYASTYAVYAACLTLDAALAAQQPQTENYTVQSTISVLALSASLYGGKDAQTLALEILRNNAGRWRGVGIPAGTQLLIRKRTFDPRVGA